jgi:GNAT superfamily N-acetyltransferase
MVRRATADDVTVLAALLDGFAKGHPAQNHSRSMDRMQDTFFNGTPLGYVLLAEENTTAIGFGIWRKTYDVFWSMYGGDGICLYVSPSRRGFGIAVAIVAAMCEDIWREGGQFLQTSYAPDLAALYERVGVGRAERACHVSASAFQKLASLVGKTPREIIRELPDRTLNFTP